MSGLEKPQKTAKLLRAKAQEFLASRKHSNNVVDIVRYMDTGADLPSCYLALEMIFTNLLREQQMFVEVVPLKPASRTPEHQYREWLRNVYEESFEKILQSCENSMHRIQIQGLATAMSIIAFEGKYPIDPKETGTYSMPVTKLKSVLMKILSSKQNTSHLVNKFEEYLNYTDILFFTWKILPQLTAKSNPNYTYITNYLLLLEKMNVDFNGELNLLCHNDADGELSFHFDGNLSKKFLNKIWNCVMVWEHTETTHKQLLIVLLERVLPHLEKPLLMTDFLMDSLDVGGPISLLALQGVFTMIQTYNLEYPNIFAKLYSMYEPEIFHTRFKARLFYLSNLFLSSTHLPEVLVAAFAKRLARLALVAPSEDIIIICRFIGNLILRHPGLKCLLNHPIGGSATSDPYIMDESDPMKSNAINSSLWEIQTLQNHILPSVATAARFINTSLPTIEWDLASILDKTGDDMFDKEIKRNGKLIALAFERPNGGSSNNKGEKMLEYWNL